MKIMETLASLFVVIVAFTNTLFPKFDLPKVLGVQIVENTATPTASISGEIKGRKAAFKEKLGGIKDERRRKVVETIDGNLSGRNEKWVNHWNNVLSRLNQILTKIKTRTQKAASDGKDVTSVNAAIASAEASIAVAQDAVNTQSGKTYTINITSENNLGTDVSATVKSFKTDIKGVIEKVEAARKAVIAAFKALKVVIGESETGASPVPSPTP